jgi:hypothetical protein
MWLAAESDGTEKKKAQACDIVGEKVGVRGKVGPKKVHDHDNGDRKDHQHEYHQ